MDTSETYIKMRRAAIPDLGTGVPNEGSCKRKDGDVWTDYKGNWHFLAEENPPEEKFQLERQDQLQEMIGIGLEPFRALVKWCIDISFKMTNHPTTEKPYWDRFDSMEQLWIVFVMKERYSKIWNGEDWERL